MDFHVGDPIVHWAHGLGEIVGIEERMLSGEKTLYYVVKIQNLTVFVPADDEVFSRLRAPTPRSDFKKLVKILSGSGESLMEDRFDRKTQLRQALSDGKAETTCRVIRDLSSFAKKKSLNDDDQTIMNRAWSSLCGEWGFALSMPRDQVEREIHGMLSQSS